MFTRNRPDRDDRPLSFFGGRAGRGEYWVFVGCVIVVAIIFRQFGGGSTSAGTGVLLLAQIRRAHDLGRTGWWAAACLAAAFAPLFLPLPMELRLGLSGLVTIAGVITFGVLPGDPGTNRFGPPSPLGRKKSDPAT